MSVEFPTRISIITIVKNGRRFIEQTIQSVLNQSYQNIEYIVIDGASTDGTLDIVKSYESRISKWISEEDGGIADAFNQGLLHASGDYILFLNSDDALASPEVLATVVKQITESDFPALIYGDYNVLKRDTGEFLYRGSVNLTPIGVRHGQILPHPCLFTHRSYFEKYGSFDSRFKIAMDYDWLLRGVFRESMVHASVIVSNIRDGGISTINTAQVIREIIDALKNNGYFSSKWSELEIRGYFFIRSCLKNALVRIGLYKLFFNLRTKVKNA